MTFLLRSRQSLACFQNPGLGVVQIILNECYVEKGCKDGHKVHLLSLTKKSVMK